MTKADVLAIKALISEERLGTFRSITHSDEDAIELHQASMLLSSSLMSVTGMLEIAMRNAVCNQIHQDYGVVDFLRAPPTGLHWHALEKKKIDEAEAQARRAAYSKLETAQKEALDAIAFPQGVPPNIKHSNLAKKRQATIGVSVGQVISQLTIFFWKRLFSEQYEPTLWKRSLKKVFPNKTYARADIAEQLEVLYQIRNRLAHHEPVYGTRLQKIVEAVDFISSNLGSRRPDPESAIAKFVLPHRELLDSQIAIFQSTFTRLTSHSDQRANDENL
ncbi:Abi family protein [Rhizobium sp. L1K21]|uniref:Abi family protein n=1 Tax=Rhizobium sp. L1K21 TaxID=2954933 RepID=UPI0020929291|nr:Abi family protein [Rhizobium sp. L1K21]MCO6186774.1 Abi family protein [Rhizobium sp. L1K21]